MARCVIFFVPTTRLCERRPVVLTRTLQTHSALAGDLIDVARLRGLSCDVAVEAEHMAVLVGDDLATLPSDEDPTPPQDGDGGSSASPLSEPRVTALNVGYLKGQGVMTVIGRESGAGVAVQGLDDGPDSVDTLSGSHGHTAAVVAATIRGRLIFTASADGSIRVWTLDGACVAALEPPVDGRPRLPGSCLCVLIYEFAT